MRAKSGRCTLHRIRAKPSVMTKRCLLFLHMRRLRPEDQLLSASFYLYTLFSVSHSFVFFSVFVCLLSKPNKRCFSAKPASPPMSGSTKGLKRRRGGIGWRNNWIHSLTVASATGLCRCEAAMKWICSAEYLLPPFVDGDGVSPRRRYKNKFNPRHPRMHCTSTKFEQKKGRRVTVCANMGAHTIPSVVVPRCELMEL